MELTVAGLLRILTGFPFDRSRRRAFSNLIPLQKYIEFMNGQRDYRKISLFISCNKWNACVSNRQNGIKMNARDFEILARSLRPGLVRTARRIVDNPDEAEDVAQDVMLKLWSMRDSLDRYDSVESLGMVMARRMALNVLRARHPSVPVEDCGESPDDLTPEEVMVRRETSTHIDAVLASLPESQQTLIRLRHVDGFDNAAIASILGSSEVAVRTALSRARRRVAEIFASSPQ